MASKGVSTGDIFKEALERKVRSGGLLYVKDKSLYSNVFRKSG
jgi:hypothetical protein